MNSFEGQGSSASSKVEKYKLITILKALGVKKSGM